MANEHGNGDAELAAMSAVRDALNPLDEQTRARVIRWATERFQVSAAPRPMTMPRTNEADAPAGGTDVAAHFHSVSPRTDAEKVLAVAYWLQQTEGLKDIDSFRVNSELRQLGFGVGNVTRAFDNLMSTKPQLVMQTRKSGTSRQARKKFRVTNEGIRAIERMAQGQPSEIEADPT